MPVLEGNLRRRMLALLMVLCVVAAACGGDDDGPAAGPDGTPGGSQQGGEADPDGVVRLAYDLQAERRGGFTWDPAEATVQIGDNGVYYLVYGGLLRPDPEGGLVPDQAESAEVLDATTIEVKLRPDQTFADGTPFDAAAVKAGIERNLAATDSTAFGSAFYDLETIEVVDPLTLRLGIPNGTAASWHDTFLGSFETAVVPPGTDMQRPSANGPFTVTAYTPGVSATLTKNDSYWDADSIRFARLDLVNAPEAQAGINALNAGQVDIAHASVALMPAISGSNETYLRADPNTLATFQVCKREGPLADPLLRKAVNKAIDREALNEAAFDGAYEPALGLWPEGHRFHDPDVEDAVSYDPAAAERLLEEAGQPDGFTFDLYVHQAGGMQETAEIIQQQLAQVGITMNLIPSANYVTDFLGASRPGAGIVPTMSANRLKLLQWSGESIGNTCHYQDDELEALEDQLNTVSDSSDEAVELWHQIEQKVVAEDTLSVFLLFGSTVAGYNADELDGMSVLPYPVVVPDPRQVYVKAS